MYEQGMSYTLEEMAILGERHEGNALRPDCWCWSRSGRGRGRPRPDAGRADPDTEIAGKGHAIAEMLFAIESARALYCRAISETEIDAPLAAVQRARAAHVTVQARSSRRR